MEKRKRENLTQVSKGKSPYEPILKGTEKVTGMGKNPQDEEKGYPFPRPFPNFCLERGCLKHNQLKTFFGAFGKL